MVPPRLAGDYENMTMPDLKSGEHADVAEQAPAGEDTFSLQTVKAVAKIIKRRLAEELLGSITKKGTETQ